MKEWILTASVLIILIIIIRQLFKNKLSARIRYGLWLIVLLRLLIPLTVSESAFSVLNMIPTTEKPVNTDIYTKVAGNENLDINIYNQMHHLQEKPYSNTLTIVNNSKPEEHEITLSKKLSLYWTEKRVWVIWISGMIICAAVLLIPNLSFSKRLRRTRVSYKESGREVTIPVYISGIIPSPCMFGLMKPCIYIRPADTANIIAMPHIVLHEFNHYKHLDHIWAFFRSICLVVHWYNPLVWLAAYLSRQDAELACDESVTAGLSEEKREEYGEVLINLSVKNNHYRDMLLCATTISQGKKHLKERISRIAKKPGFYVASTSVVLILGIIAVCVTFTRAKTENDKNDLSGNNNVISEESDLTTNPKKDTSSFTTEPDLTDSATPSTDSESEESQEQTVFINDFLVDMNGDGILDIWRLNGIGMVSQADDFTSADALKDWIAHNVGGYMKLALYDGARAVPSMTSFKKGDEVSTDAFITSFEPALAHAGNIQYSYYEEDGRGYLIENNPWFGQGYGAYHFQVIKFGENWIQYTVEEKELAFSVMQYEPWDYRTFETYLLETFPIEDMIAYTLDIKKYLDKAKILVDTSISDTFTVTTKYESEMVTPDAYAIWLHLFRADSEAELRKMLYETAYTLGSGYDGYVETNYDSLAKYLCNHYDIDEAYWYRYPPIADNPAGEDRSIPASYWKPSIEFSGTTSNISHLPENSKNLPATVVIMAYEDVLKYISRENYSTYDTDNNLLVEYDSPLWQDWCVNSLEWCGTYQLNDAYIDVYRYNYILKLHDDIDRIKLNEDPYFWAGPTYEVGDGWYQFTYSNSDYICYDKNTQTYFTMFCNDGSPGDNVFTGDLIVNYNNIFWKFPLPEVP